MCLYTKQILPIRARRDITVYKYLYLDITTNKYLTPCQGVPVSLNSTFEALEKDILLPTRKSRFLGGNISVIEAGFIHCYTTLESAIHEIVSTRSFIVKCTIKKGTLYYKAYIHHQICAKSVEIHGIVAWKDVKGNIHIKK